MTPSAEYRPDIDGLRALAVLVVILYHFDIAGFTGGFTGVDIFFVISGYLIIRIIYNELAAGTFSLRNFWERRVRRIIPAMVVVLLATAAAAYYFLLLPSDLVDFGTTLMLQGVFLANFWFMGVSDYFAAPALTMPLLHTWTLAVEEQFYIIFPLVAVLLCRFLGQQVARLKLLMVALVVASFAYSLWLVYGVPTEQFSLVGFPHVWGSATGASAAFYFILPRLWEFVVGGLVAVYAWRIKNALFAEVTAMAGLMAILAGVFLVNEAMVFPGVAVLLPVLGTAAVIVGNTEQSTLVRTILSAPYLVWFGLLSYSLYLWHWPVLVFSKYRLYDGQALSPATVILLFGLIVCLSWLTYRYVETPIRQKRFLKNQSQLFLAALLSVALVVLAGFLIVRQAGFPERLSEQGQVIAAAMSDYNPRQAECFTRSEIAQQSEHTPCLLGLQNPEQIDFVLWGDSHANALMPAFDVYGIETGQTGIFFGVGACTPIPSNPPLTDDPVCLRELERAMSFIQTQKPKEVFMVAEWKDGYKFANSDEGWYLYALLSGTIELMPKDTTVTVFHRFPGYQNYNIRKILMQTEREGKELQLLVPRAEFEASQHVFYEQVELGIAGHENARAVDPATKLCDEEYCYLGTDKGLYNLDSTHPSNYGAMQIVLPLLLELYAQEQSE